MKDFRVVKARRVARASEQGCLCRMPSLEWEYQVDERLRKQHMVCHQAGRETQVVVDCGYAAYADDTGMVGVAEEEARKNCSIRCSLIGKRSYIRTRLGALGN